ncbi:MAG: glycosyltransferase [Candidatus Micrarchaeota archaeon]|nr:glycosyltransferase [Candidatus Micrarchaeota archaeon]MDE1804165.1 glycosyltransferase [Candidatus Micrarchaeota archaeon]
MPLISVIIPTLNEEKYIRYAFEGLKAQTFRDFEVIVSDKESTDKTRQIARRAGAKVVIQKKAGISAGRNAGAKVAKGRILVFIDADTKPSKNLLKTYSEAIGNGVIAATGPIFPLEKVSKSVYMGYEFVSGIFVELSILFGVPSIVGSNFAIDRKVFEKVRGFDEGLITYEDWDLSRRVKPYGRIEYLKGAYVNASARRVEAWGIGGYFIFHVGNMVKYQLFRSAHKSYPPIR